jgi:hypothetical protein
VLTVPENVDAIHSMILEGHRISAKDGRESGDILETCKVHQPLCVGHEEAVY